MGMSALPRSPVKTILVHLPDSRASISRIAEPRMWPASRYVTSSLVQVLQVVALDVRRVSEEYLAQVRGRVRGVDGSAEALLDQSGQAAAVIDVSVREQDDIYRGGVERKPPVAPLALGPAPLIEAAIE
jgi:hypothetical protein